VLREKGEDWNRDVVEEAMEWNGMSESLSVFGFNSCCNFATCEPPRFSSFYFLVQMKCNHVIVFFLSIISIHFPFIYNQNK